jgi:hypothetical protein
MKAQMLARYCARGEKMLRSTRSRRRLVDLAKNPYVVMAVLSKSIHPDAPLMLDALCEHEMKRYLQRIWRQRRRADCYKPGNRWIYSGDLARGFSQWWTAKKREVAR